MRAGFCIISPDASTGKELIDPPLTVAVSLSEYPNPTLSRTTSQVTASVDTSW